MNTILFDDDKRADLLPLTFTRPVADLRVGILTIKEKWAKWLKTKVSYHTEEYLQEKFPMLIEEDNLLINGALLPEKEIVEAISLLKNNDALVKNGKLLALRVNRHDFHNFNTHSLTYFNTNEYDKTTNLINFPWDIFTLNEQEIEIDFLLLTQGRKSQPISPTNRFVKPERIFIEEGASVEFSILNPANGYIYIGKDAEVMENATVHGSLALCEHSVLKIGAKIYGATTVGPHSKVGGEVSNSIFIGYSNKGHDGFLGNSVLGEWCNLGADTNNSNLKNNYAIVKMWNYPQKRFVNTNLQFAGLIMGDHSKSGINTMFNTGTVVGVFANIFGSGFPRNFVPSFSWGGASGFSIYQTQKAYEVAEKVMERRHIKFDDVERKILDKVFELTAEFRS
jgi:UDP-N-acetylglucosamine diphosphorylase/glucosamine-1-phosphate N-acetyltransferase